MPDQEQASPELDDQQDARGFLADLEKGAETRLTPCGDGMLVWRSWGAGPPLVLLHGGAGSWRHWALSIAPLSRSRRVIVPDLPGLGDSAEAPDPVSQASVAGLLAGGLDGLTEPYDLVGFSFGGSVAGLLAGLEGPRVRSLTLVGAGGFGRLGPRPRTVPVLAQIGEERRAAHRQNLASLMIQDPGRIDALAVEIQEQNTRRTRIKTQSLSGIPVLPEVLPRLACPLHGIWGERDHFTVPHLDQRFAMIRDLRPDADLHLVAGAGHWVMYEAADRVNALLLQLLQR